MSRKLRVLFHLEAKEFGNILAFFFKYQIFETFNLFLNYSLDGKQKKTSESESPVKPVVAYQRGIPDYDYQIGTLRFIRTSAKVAEDQDNSDAPQFQPFSGSGQSLRQTKQRKWFLLSLSLSRHSNTQNFYNLRNLVYLIS